jgi:hypothetical protein
MGFAKELEGFLTSITVTIIIAATAREIEVRHHHLPQGFTITLLSGSAERYKEGLPGSFGRKILLSADCLRNEEEK